MERNDKIPEESKEQSGTCRNASRRGGGTSRRTFLRSTATLGAGVLLAGKTLSQEQAAQPAPAEAAAAEGAAPAAPAAEGAAAAEAAAPAAAAAAQPAPTPPKNIKRKGPGEDINIVMIGLGAQGRVLMESILRIPNIRVKAICDIWEYSSKRAAGTLKKFGHDVNVYEDYQELLANEKDIDAAVIASPDFRHAEHAIACMQAGLDVYCEKEMSNDLAKARDMVLTSRRTGRLLQIGHQRRSNPRYRHAIEKLILDVNLLGRVTHANAQWNRAVSEDLGWPKKYEIPPDKLEKYGFASMSHFRNWRWYKQYGGGPIVDLGSHQIDLFAWIWGVNPRSVMASGGIDYYKHHHWYDNVLCIYEYETPQGVNRAFYQVLTTTSNGSFAEEFMGENGTLAISEVPQNGDEARRESRAPDWEPFAKQGLLLPQESAGGGAKSKDIAIDVRTTPKPGAWGLPVQLFKPAHQPHLENFFDAIRLGVPLNCPGEIGYETAVAVLKVNEAVEAGRTLHFRPEEFEV